MWSVIGVDLPYLDRSLRGIVDLAAQSATLAGHPADSQRQYA